MKVILIDKSDDRQTVSLRDSPVGELMAGDVALRVSHATVNDKDCLAITNRAPVVRQSHETSAVRDHGITETAPSFCDLAFSQAEPGATSAENASAPWR